MAALKVEAYRPQPRARSPREPAHRLPFDLLRVVSLSNHGRKRRPRGAAFQRLVVRVREAKGGPKPLIFDATLRKYEIDLVGGLRYGLVTI